MARNNFNLLSIVHNLHTGFVKEMLQAIKIRKSWLLHLFVILATVLNRPRWCGSTAIEACSTTVYMLATPRAQQDWDLKILQPGLQADERDSSGRVTKLKVLSTADLRGVTDLRREKTKPSISSTLSSSSAPCPSSSSTLASSWALYSVDFICNSTP